MKIMIAFETGPSMQTYADLRKALRYLSHYTVEYRGPKEALEANDNAQIKDESGAVIGQWHISDSEPACASCGHSFSDHEEGEVYGGACWHGAGEGNRCSCSEFSRAYEDELCECGRPINQCAVSAGAEQHRDLA